MSRTYVFAIEFQVPASERVGPVLELHQESLIDLGARYAFVYESIPEPGKVLVVVGIRTEQPLLNLLRSPYFFEWFDAVGVNELPAVFAGEKVERFDLGDEALGQRLHRSGVAHHARSVRSFGVEHHRLAGIAGPRLPG